MSNEDAVLEVMNSLPEVERAAQWLELQLVGSHAPARVIGKLQVALDEVIANIINHGLRGIPQGTRPIRIYLRRRSNEVEVEIVDDGPQFDPTSAVAPRPANEHDVRRLGGAGLPFLRALMDDMIYLRQGDLNQLVLRVRWPTTNE